MPLLSCFWQAVNPECVEILGLQAHGKKEESRLYKCDFHLGFYLRLMSNIHSCAADTVTVKNAAGSSDRDLVMVLLFYIIAFHERSMPFRIFSVTSLLNLSLDLN